MEFISYLPQVTEIAETLMFWNVIPSIGNFKFKQRILQIYILLSVLNLSK
jgi:hypothetical protein